MKLARVLCGALVLAVATGVQAELIDLGNGIVLDDRSSLYWLEDANLAKTSGYHATGLMTWAEAETWASGLEVGGSTDWRLPSAGESPCFDCGTSEYTTLYAQGIRVPAPALNDPIGDPGPFINLPAHEGYYDSVIYWTGTPESSPSTAWAYVFSGPGFFANYLGGRDVDQLAYAWAVRAAPEPDATLVTLAALAAVASCRSLGKRVMRRADAGGGRVRLRTRRAGVRARRRRANAAPGSRARRVAAIQGIRRMTGGGL